MARIESTEPPRMNPPVQREPRPPSVGGLLRAALKENWRRLRTMRTALWLLGFLGLETIVATIVPQEMNVPQTVANWRSGQAGPGEGVSAVLDAIGAFGVYTSPLFLTLLVLLFTSLTACLVPRVRSWWRITRHSVPPFTRHLGAQEHVAELTTSLDPDRSRAVVRGVLTDRRWRLREREDQLAAEKGLVVREGGSLAFHLSFYVLLFAIVLGQFLTFEGSVGIVEGTGFTDTQVGYWRYQPGRWFGPEDHDGFTLRSEEFRVEWIRDVANAGVPTTFEIDVTVTEADGTVTTDTIAGNHPMVVDGAKIHLLGWGYAPRVIVRQGGEVVFDDFITTTVDGDTGTFRSAVKAPAAEPDVGLDVFMFAFAPEGDDGQPVLTGAPWADAPLLVFRSFTGDLQLAAVQNVNELDTDEMVEGPRGGLRLGQSVRIGNDVSVEFAELRRWTNLQVSRRPHVPALLLGATLLLVGLLPALYAYRRRLWVGVERSPDGRTLLTVAGRAFQRPEAFTEEFDDLTAALREATDAARTARSAVPTAPDDEVT